MIGKNPLYGSYEREKRKSSVSLCGRMRLVCRPRSMAFDIMDGGIEIHSHFPDMRGDVP